jgi:hypothetical protein
VGSVCRQKQMQSDLLVWIGPTALARSILRGP